MKLDKASLVRYEIKSSRLVWLFTFLPFGHDFIAEYYFKKVGRKLARIKKFESFLNEHK